MTEPIEGQSMGRLLGAMLCGKDPENRDRFEEAERERALKVQRELTARRLRAARLRVKLVEALESAALQAGTRRE